MKETIILNNLFIQFKSKLLLVLPVLFLLLFFSGCIQHSQITQYAPEKLTFESQSFFSSNTCKVMVCQYKEKSLVEKVIDWFGNLIGQKETKVPSLAGGNCSFKEFDLTLQQDKKNLDNLFLSALNSSSNILNFTQIVMIGTEASIIKGEEFKSYCNGNLGFMIIDTDLSKMVIDPNTQTDDYKTNALRAECILNSSTIPFYRIYSYKPSYSLFAEALKDKGPVFIAPGYGFSTNSTRFSRYSSFNPTNPSGLFTSIKAWCPNCMTVAVVQFNDSETLNFYKQSGDINNIDVIGFTVDVNSFETCDTFKILLDSNNSVKSFAQNITSLYHKPVMILSISIKEGNVYNSQSEVICEWTNESIADFYQQLFRSIPYLTKSGVIGIGLIPNTNIPLAFNTSAYFCSIYYNKDVQKPYFVPVIFSKEGDVLSGCNKYIERSNFIAMPNIDDPNLFKQIKLSKVEYQTCSNIVYTPPIQPPQPGETPQPSPQPSPEPTPSLPPLPSPGESTYDKAVEFQELATNNKIDYYLLLAALNYYNQIKEPVSSLSLMNSHCTCSGLSDAKYNRCCIAETLSYYYYKKDVVHAAGTDTDFRKYLALYGLIAGDAGLSAEIYRKTNPEISENYLRNPFIDNILKSGSTVKVE